MSGIGSPWFGFSILYSLYNLHPFGHPVVVAGIELDDRIAILHENLCRVLASSAASAIYRNRLILRKYRNGLALKILLEHVDVERIGKVADNAIVMSWRGIEGGIEAAQKGHDVIMVPTSYLYFDYYQSEDIANEPLGIGGYVPVERAYSFNPVPEELNAEEQQHIIGVQANIWTEYIATFNHVMYMALPRAAALAEVQWCSQEQRNYDAFLNRMNHMAQLYDLYHYNYAKHIFHPELLLDTIAPTLATHKPITLRQDPPSEQYAAQGASTLNNGILGKGAYNSDRWLGFRGYPIDAVIDLENATEISHVNFNANVNKGSWIYNPKSATVMVSDDGENFRNVAHDEYPISTWEDKDGIFHYSLDFDPVSARYVEVVIESFDLPADHEAYGEPAWLFVDEIEVK